jgi:hypothetical protein
MGGLTYNGIILLPGGINDTEAKFELQPQGNARFYSGFQEGENCM